MQVFSLPDASVALDARTDAAAANGLLGALNVYQIVEDPFILSGHTFSPDTETPKRVLHRWPDANYPLASTTATFSGIIYRHSGKMHPPSSKFGRQRHFCCRSPSMGAQSAKIPPATTGRG